jgi:hypothetical protein
MTDSIAPDDERPSATSGEGEAETEGIWGLVGLWEGIMTDEEVDEFVRHVYVEREKDKGRPLPTFD